MDIFSYLLYLLRSVFMAVCSATGSFVGAHSLTVVTSLKLTTMRHNRSLALVVTHSGNDTLLYAI